MFSIGLYRERIQIFLTGTTWHRALVIWYLVSSSKPLHQVVQIMAMLPKWTDPAGHVFYIGFNRESMKQYSQSRDT